jgi:hypothetical protein
MATFCALIMSGFTAAFLAEVQVYASTTGTDITACRVVAAAFASTIAEDTVAPNANAARHPTMVTLLASLVVWLPPS